MGATRHAESRADFIHKVSLATKELGETLYWLRLIARAPAPHAARGPARRDRPA